jgi:hypothetical protein
MGLKLAKAQVVVKQQELKELMGSLKFIVKVRP